MKWLKRFENINQNKDLKLGELKISDRRVFDSLVFNFSWQGKKKLIDYDVSQRNFRRCSLSAEACDFLFNIIEENRKLIIDAYGQSNYNGFEKALQYYYNSVKKKSEGVKIITKKFNNIPIYFTDYKGNPNRLFIYKIEKDNDVLTIFVNGYNRAKDSDIHISKDIFKYGDEDIHFWSHYTKSFSKFQDDVRQSEDFYNLIKSNIKEVPPFITPKYFEDLGWDVRSERAFKDAKSRFYDLYENNQILLVKEDKRVVFDFDTYKAIFYDKNLNQIDEIIIKKNSDLNIFK